MLVAISQKREWESSEPPLRDEAVCALSYFTSIRNVTVLESSKNLQRLSVIKYFAVLSHFRSSSEWSRMFLQSATQSYMDISCNSPTILLLLPGDSIYSERQLWSCAQSNNWLGSFLRPASLILPHHHCQQYKIIHNQLEARGIKIITFWTRRNNHKDCLW